MGGSADGGRPLRRWRWIACFAALVSAVVVVAMLVPFGPGSESAALRAPGVAADRSPADPEALAASPDPSLQTARIASIDPVADLAPETSADSGELGATLIVRVVGWPAASSGEHPPTFEVSAYGRRSDGSAVPHTFAGVRAQDGAARAELAVPANVPLFVAVIGLGVRFSTRAEPVVLAAGERREVVVDLDAECALRVIVEGLPAELRAGAAVDLRFLQRVHDGSSPWVRPAARSERAFTDAHGETEFRGFTRGAVELSLRRGTRSYPFVDVFDGAPSWPLCWEPVVRVRPAEPLVALAPVTADGERLRGQAFALSVGEGWLEAPQRHEHDLVLATERAVRESDAVTLYTAEHGMRRVAPSELRELEPGLLGVPVPDPAELGAIRVRLGGPPPADLGLDCALLVDGRAERLMTFQREYLRRGLEATGPAGAPLFTVLREEDALHLRGLPPGTYRLSWSWRANHARPFGAPVSVEGGRCTEVAAEPPETRHVQGRVEGWEELSEELRPNRLVLDGTRVRLVDGRFELDAAFPLESEVWIQGPGMLLWPSGAPPAWDAEAGELVVRCPVERLTVTRFHVEAVIGGRVVAEMTRMATAVGLETYLVPRRLYVHADERGELALVRYGAEPVDVVVRELAAGGGICRGWLRLPADAERGALELPGRWVDVAFREPGALVELHLERAWPAGGAPLPQVALGTFDSSEIPTVWIPAQATALGARAGGRAARRALGGADTESILLPLP